MLGGWISIDRALQDHNIVGIKKYNGSPNHKVMVFWIWLLMNANYDESEIFVKGKLISIGRGQYYGSIRFISEGTAFSTKETRNILQVLKKGKLITVENIVGQTMITICNYSTYQQNDEDRQTPSKTKKGKRGASEGQARGKQKGTKYNKDNNTNNNIGDLFEGDEPNIKLDEFEDFWIRYGKIGPKKDAKAKFKIVRRTVDLITLTDGLKNYEKHLLANKDWLKKKMLSTWLNKEGWTEEFDTGSKTTMSNDEEDLWMNRVQEFIDHNLWNDDKWGFTPDHNRTQVPNKILKQFNMEK